MKTFLMLKAAPQNRRAFKQARSVAAQDAVVFTPFQRVAPAALLGRRRLLLSGKRVSYV